MPRHDALYVGKTQAMSFDLAVVAQALKWVEGTFLELKIEPHAIVTDQDRVYAGIVLFCPDFADRQGLIAAVLQRVREKVDCGGKQRWPGSAWASSQRGWAIQRRN